MVYVGVALHFNRSTPCGAEQTSNSCGVLPQQSCELPSRGRHSIPAAAAAAAAAAPPPPLAFAEVFATSQQVTQNTHSTQKRTENV